MAGFDESPLARLETLVAKARAGNKLPANEALELKELKLLKSVAEIAKKRAEIAVARRKIDDREKYRIGGLAVAAGLAGWSDDALKAAFAKLAAHGQTEKFRTAQPGELATTQAETNHASHSDKVL